MRSAPRRGLRRVFRSASRTAGRTAVLLALCALLGSVAPPAQASVPPAAQATGVDPAAPAAAALATDGGYRTGVAVLDLSTGAYTGAGEDAGSFPSESVVKVFIAVRLLLTGQMSGTTDATAYRMITASDDAAADTLYDRAGGDAVVALVGAHYGIPDLGTPPSTPGRWGLTGITARGLVRFYAAVAQDPTVFPWLGNAMAHAERVAADGTDQFFGLPAAVAGTAVKQGWGHEGIGTGDAVTNSTGYVDGGRVAVAILTAGPASTYGAAIQATVTAQARALLAAAPAAAPSEQPPPVVAAAAGAGPPGVAAPTSRDEPLPVSRLLTLAGTAAALGAALYGGRRLQLRLRTWRADRRARRRRRRAARRRASGHGPRTVLVRLPSGQLVRLGTTPQRRPAPAAAASGARAPARLPVARTA